MRGIRGVVLGALVQALTGCQLEQETRFDRADLGSPDDYTLRRSRSFVDGDPAMDSEGNVHVVVEIPAGTTSKWEVDKRDGALRWEFRGGQPRVVQYLGYPGNYGMIPRTLLAREDGGDGDPLDVLLLGDAMPRGAVAKARVVGVLRMQDDGEQDDKLIAVHQDSHFAQARSIQELRQQFPGVCEIVETWFRNYKGPGRVVTAGYGNAEEAQQVLRVAMRAFERRSGD